MASISGLAGTHHEQAETTDIFNSSKGSIRNGSADINYDVVLSNCNARLTKWDEDWRVELERCERGESILSFDTDSGFQQERKSFISHSLLSSGYMSGCS